MKNTVSGIILASALVFSATVARADEEETAGCKTLFVNFVEGWTPRETGASPDKLPPMPQSGRRITGVFTCHGGNYYLPSMTVMHFLEEKPNGQICYHDRACGNVDSWDFYFGLSASFWHRESRLTDFSSSGGLLAYRGHFMAGENGRSTVERNGSMFSIDVGVNWGHINRYCKALSEEVCL